MGGRQALRQLPTGRGGPPRIRPTSEASRAVFAVFDATSPLVEGISIDEAFLDVGGLRRVSGTPAEIARRAAPATCASRSGWRSPWASPAPSSWPRWPAGWPNPTASWWCRPPASSPSCTRSRGAPVGGRADHRREAARRGIATVAEVARARPRTSRGGPARAGVRAPPPRPGAQPRSPAGGGGADGGARSGLQQRASGAPVRAPPRRSTPCWWRWWTGSPGGCGRQTGWAAPWSVRLRFGDCPAGHPIAHVGPSPPADTQVVLAALRAVLAEARPLIEDQWA
jgi:hypothetical protein